MTRIQSDAVLLRNYRRRGDEASFRLLVERYSALVQGTALRRTEDPEQARETAQQVFVLLAKNAWRLRAGSGLAGWLHRTAVLVSGAVIRREKRRGRLLRRYADHVQLSSGSPDGRLESWSKALPLVDEALTRLPEKDRGILLAHFWQGRTYREIAAATASTEAAVQRRASRAFVRLGTWLRRHQSEVPAGILAVGLGMLAQPHASAAAAAPPSLSLAAAALSQARHFPFRTALRWRLAEALAFDKMKLAGGFLAACLVALTGIAGFAAGRFSGRMEQARRQLDADTAAARTALGALARNQPPAPPAPPRKSLAEIIKAAAAFYRDGNDPISSSRGQLALAGIRPEEVPAALGLLAGQLHDPAIGAAMVPRLIQIWAPAITRDEAVIWLMKNRAEVQQSFAPCLFAALGSWTAREPFEARDWCRARSPSAGAVGGMDLDTDTAPVSSVYFHFPEEALESVWEELPSLPPDELPYAMNALARLAMNPARRQEIHGKITTVPDGRIRAGLLEQVGESLGRSDPEAAVDWLRDLPLADTGQAMKVRVETAGQFLAERPDLALRIFLESPADEYRDAIMAKLFKESPSHTAK